MEKIKQIVKYVGALAITLLLSACSTGISQTEYDSVVNEKQTLKAEVESLKTEIESLKKEYNDYRGKMQPYEELEAKETEARKLEAQKKLEEEEEAKKKEEEQKKIAEEEKAKKGYDTGITFNQLAREPDKYTKEKVKFSGQIIQTIEEDGKVIIRLIVDGVSSQVIVGLYDKNLVSVRLLEGDWITIYGVSYNLYTYIGAAGTQVSAPLINIDKIDY